MKDTSDIFDFYQKIHNDILIGYTGTFDNQVLGVIAKNLGDVLEDESPKASKKIFKIFIELAQNIAFYSAETQTDATGATFGVGTLLVRNYQNSYLFATGNIVHTEKIQPVIEKCEKINSLDRDGLREYKRKQRNLPQGPKGGGNIGLIQVALTADSTLKYNLIPIDDKHSFYAIGIEIQKD